MSEVPSTAVTVTNVDIPFGRLVSIILKLMLASIPALILFYTIFFVLALIFVAIFGGGAAILNNFIGHH